MPAYMNLLNNQFKPGGLFGNGPAGAASPQPSSQQSFARPQSAPAAGISVPGNYGNPMQGSSPQQQQQWREQTAANTRAAQSRLDSNEDRQRILAQERDMTAANQQMAANVGGTVSGQWGYVYPGAFGGSGGSRSSGGGAGGGGTAGLDGLIAQLTQQAQPPVAAPDRIPPPQVPQASGMFAHAKDVSGRVGNKALAAFRNLMTKRGMSDSGMEAEGEADILGQIANQQSDAEYDQANINNSRQWEANQMGYQGDMGQSALGYQGAIQQRGQGIQALLQLLNMRY